MVKAKSLLCKQPIAAYVAAMVDIPSQISYGGRLKIRHAVPLWLPFNNTGLTLPENMFLSRRHPLPYKPVL